MRLAWMLLLLLMQGNPDPEALEWFRKGEALIGTEKAFSDEQADQFAKAVEIDPDFAEARYNLGLVELRRGRLEEALEQFQAHIALRPQQPQAYFLAGRALLQLERDEQAVERLREGLELDDSDVGAWSDLARALFNLEQMEESVKASRRALELSGGDPQLRYPLAAALLELGRPQEAAQQLRRQLSLQPDDYQAAYLLGEILLQDPERQEEAAEWLLKSESLDDSDPRLAALLGDLLVSLGREEEAAPRLSRADQQSFSTLANQGVLALREERYAEAEQLLRQALAKEPFHPLIWGHLGDALAAQDKKREAIAAYDQALSYDPDDLKSLVNAGVLAADGGRQDEAREYLERAIEQAPQDGFVHYSLAVVLDRLGEDEERLLALYLKSLELGEKRPLAHYRLAFLLAKQGQPEEALDHLEKALQADAERFYPQLLTELRRVRSDLDSIRYTSRFAQLLDQYRQEGTPQEPESPPQPPPR
ncbi:MAG TPA: tetratricopeptide repeat protein [Acidobacteriota bacterium]|nr:tetratricopeptide repeat protein [Acidobacteriota bacterium]